MNDDAVVKLLQYSMVPTLGCTDPAVVAYCASLARSVTEGELKKANVTVDKNIFKNALNVTIPGTRFQGLDYACALGLAGGKHQLALQVLRDIGEEDIAGAAALVKKGQIEIQIRMQSGLFVEVCVETGEGYGRCRIEKTYTNVTQLEGSSRAKQAVGNEENAEKEDFYNQHVADLTIERILEFVAESPLEKLKFIEEGCKLNLAIAEAGLKVFGNNCFGQMNKESVADDNNSSMIASAKMLTSSAVLMRMDGFALPVMAIAGSGNQGIAALVPIMAVAEAIGAGKDMIIRAAALSSLITIYIKERTGITSPICGGSIAGGAGASAGIAYLIGGDKVVITNAVTNAIGGLAGMICDGAKSGCAFKLSISAGTAVEAAIMSMSGAVIPSNNGIVGADLNQTIENLAQVTNAGMESVDDIMIEIMTSRNNQTSKTFQFK